MSCDYFANAFGDLKFKIAIRSRVTPLKGIETTKLFFYAKLCLSVQYGGILKTRLCQMAYDFNLHVLSLSVPSSFKAFTFFGLIHIVIDNFVHQVYLIVRCHHQISS